MGVKKIIPLVVGLVAAILISMPVASYAADARTDVEYADMLKGLGMLAGTDNGYELDRQPTRAEAAVMLLRMLGKEAEAKAKNYKHPFTDVPGWASPYIGYMYENKMTSGIGDSKYGSDQLVSASAYTTFILRALGYNDSQGDFTYNGAVDFARAQGVYSNDDYTRFVKPTYTRGDMVVSSVRALASNVKGQSQMMISKLATNGTVKKDAVVRASMMSLGLPSPDNNATYKNAKAKSIISYIGNNTMTDGEKEAVKKQIASETTVAFDAMADAEHNVNVVRGARVYSPKQTKLLTDARNMLRIRDFMYAALNYEDKSYLRNFEAVDETTLYNNRVITGTISDDQSAAVYAKVVEAIKNSPLPDSIWNNLSVYVAPYTSGNCMGYAYGLGIVLMISDEENVNWILHHEVGHIVEQNMSDENVAEYNAVRADSDKSVKKDLSTLREAFADDVASIYVPGFNNRYYPTDKNSLELVKRGVDFVLSAQSRMQDRVVYLVWKQTKIRLETGTEYTLPDMGLTFEGDYLDMVVVDQMDKIDNLKGRITIPQDSGGLFDFYSYYRSHDDPDCLLGLSFNFVK